MKYGKQLKKMMACNDHNSTMVGIALIGGLAVGAALAVLFAPKKGSDLREGIADSGRQVSGTLAELMDAIKAKFGGGDTVEPEVLLGAAEMNHTATPVKRPKSDIGELLHEAHKEGHFPEQHV
ncbi:YtxH domain-containing protein [Pedobacter heparinus]|uniref:YtxH domain-containing protein n=1 Tax=Pedobacter heparinus TaxID=984 RepID=UPI00292CF8D1|nr:YtxH domain-containing protein [Pedobacter heparinus]